MTDTSWAAIKHLQNEVHENAVAKGFWDGVTINNEFIGNKLMLIVGEVAEAHEELRRGVNPTETYYPHKPHDPSFRGGPYKPEGVPSELADVVIRAFDLAGGLGIDLAKAIYEKHEYNTTRERLHGKSF